ncbi:vacuolar membrane protein-domain-containing protein [Halteromyces radiatus]|uniref:vacuolar membrane protein-domain-containing protein n=1 Tax=Halteromyces radiatus TaxID=101107 RepID=UPI00221FE1C3|nr:vacuolar membrane protein-domain-containing protein [Halteromyces radiatus]XP_051403654.1 vacuolar membrane protein-domain-containing protein [Halteromyces radiatus]KAI8075970.1 vacuolar membrane protein-domain-containing protein [Halteromyces radiatus]KAI8097420.1 vacuolar membrane protein-domain-containing protein [Halteromyces radiatus]
MLYNSRSIPFDKDDEQQEGCKLLDTFAIFVQLLLACVAFSTLIIKRQREKPRRPLRIWGFDISKQVVGGIVIHTLNLVMSYISGYSLEDSSPSNPCVWYWLNIFVDTTLGTAIIWGILRLGQFIARQWGFSGFENGVYGSTFRKQIERWWKQLLMYVTALIMMKLLVLLLFRLCPWLEWFGEWVLGWTSGNYKIQVVFVMLIFPLIMNIAQFWIVDTILKHNSQHTPIHLDDAMDEDILIPIYDDEDDDSLDNNHLNQYDDDDDSHWPPPIHSPLMDGEQDAVSLSSSLKPLTGLQDDDDQNKKEFNLNPWTYTSSSNSNQSPPPSQQ